MMNTMRTALAIAICASILITATHGTTLQTLIDAKATILSELSQKATIAHRNRCTDFQNGCSTLGCSLPACGNTFPTSKGFACNTSWGKNPELCTTNDGSGCNGLWTSVQEGTIRFAKETDFSDSEVAAFTCASKRMDEVFQANDVRGNLNGWQYVGSMTGVSRFYPGQPQYRSSTCCPYDPRVRPWFITATAGPKDVVLVMDTSGSMGGSGITAMKATAKALLGSMTVTDYVGVVGFSDSANRFSSTLSQGTDDNIASMQSFVNGFKASGSTAMEKGFEEAFNILDRSENTASKCTKIIIFLTDGMANSPEKVIPAVNAGQKKLGSNPAHIFTYSMGSGADDVLPKQIACENDGVWGAIRDGEDPLNKMSKYYQFLAAGIDSTQVRWTSPYEDAFGLGQMVTGAVPVYDRTQSVPLLVGVVGTDVLMSELGKYGNTDTVVAELISRSKTCPKISLQKCQMQHIRGTAAQCTTDAYVDDTIAKCNDRNEIVELKTCVTQSNAVNSVLCEQLSESTQVSVSSPKSSQEVACCKNCNAPGRTDNGVCRIALGSSQMTATVSILLVAIIAVVM